MHHTALLQQTSACGLASQTIVPAPATSSTTTLRKIKSPGLETVIVYSAVLQMYAQSGPVFVTLTHGQLMIVVASAQHLGPPQKLTQAVFVTVPGHTAQRSKLIVLDCPGPKSPNW
jgi:hypothetical protein